VVEGISPRGEHKGHREGIKVKKTRKKEGKAKIEAFILPRPNEKGGGKTPDDETYT